MYADRTVLGDPLMRCSREDVDEPPDLRVLLGTYPVGAPHPYPGDRLTEDGRTWVVTTIARQGDQWEAYGYELPDG